MRAFFIHACLSLGSKPRWRREGLDLRAAPDLPNPAPRRPDMLCDLTCGEWRESGLK
jgi:hypothetical protein